MALGKMHLPGRPANMGAHLLAWELGLEPERLIPFETVHPGMIDRMLAGELVPGAMLAEKISRLTLGRVPLGAWSREARGAWGDPPATWARDWAWRMKRDRAAAKKMAA